MTRDDALTILKELGNSPNMLKHAYACEAAMRALARRLEPDKEEAWGFVGLLHDADYEATDKSLERHTDKTSEKLELIGAPQDIIDAIRGHCDKEPRATMMAKAIYTVDELTGLVVAAALVHPEKLTGLTVDSVARRFQEPSFAKGVNRDQIKTCEDELGIPLHEFMGITLAAMQGESEALGL
ncbi:HDIG domain-containing protein [Candidatus Microgenomates bacterium]|nr:HDIG domain-containing protein [Candidatus Microgenomates bacterium]